jgi:hypothetical protein
MSSHYSPNGEIMKMNESARERFNWYKKKVHIYKNIENIKLMVKEINQLIDEYDIQIEDEKMQ